MLTTNAFDDHDSHSSTFVSFACYLVPCMNQSGDKLRHTGDTELFILIYISSHLHIPLTKGR